MPIELDVDYSNSGPTWATCRSYAMKVTQLKEFLLRDIYRILNFESIPFLTKNYHTFLSFIIIIRLLLCTMLIKKKHFVLLTCVTFIANWRYVLYTVHFNVKYELLYECWEKIYVYVKSIYTYIHLYVYTLH